MSKRKAHGFAAYLLAAAAVGGFSTGCQSISDADSVEELKKNKK